VAGCVDDDPSLWGTELRGWLPVLGGLDVVAQQPDSPVVLCAGRGSTRAAMGARLTVLGVGEERYTTVVHPSVQVPESCTVGAGTVLLAGVVLTAEVSLGRHVVVMPHVTLTHDDVVEDYGTLCAGVVLGGSVRVGPRAYLGMGSSVREGVRVGADAMLGMGAALTRDLPDGQVWAGVPAAPLGSGRRLPDAPD
jgi:sugar O-acyltransferase (sialic acid O-acetyltransferase NeuD family)